MYVKCAFHFTQLPLLYHLFRRVAHTLAENEVTTLRIFFFVIINRMIWIDQNKTKKINFQKVLVEIRSEVKIWPVVIVK